MRRWPTSPQVIVVGGGPAGSSTAWHLAQRGIEVLLVDRAVFPRDKPCGEYLSPEGSRILESMGALPLVEKAGAAELAGMTVRTPSGKVIRGEFASTHGFRGFRDCGLALRRDVLDNIVLGRARAAGVSVVEGAKVEQVLRNNEGTCCGVIVRWQGELHEIPAQFVIGADGLRSQVARRLQLAYSSSRPRRYAMVAHFHNARVSTTMGEMFVKRGAYLGLCNVGHGITNVGFVVSQPRGTSFNDAPENLLSEFIESHAELRERFARAERIGEVAVTGPFASHARRGWAPGAALVGDAADFFDPFTGEGMFAALRGGEILAPFVAEALAARSVGAANAALTAYDRARTKTFAGKWRVEKLIGLAVEYPWLLEKAAVVLQRDPHLADLVVGVTGDFVPPRELLRFSVLRRLFMIKPQQHPLTQHAHRS